MTQFWGLAINGPDIDIVIDEAIEFWEPVSLEGKNKYGHSGLMFVLGENVHIVFDIIY